MCECVLCSVGVHERVCSLRECVDVCVCECVCVCVCAFVTVFCKRKNYNGNSR